METPADDLCPYCGEGLTANGGEERPARCPSCLAFLDPLSRDVTRRHMGPWFIRDGERPHYPGVAWEVLAALAERGDLTASTVVRGPGTGQFWARAGRVPGVAHLVGRCHGCGGRVERRADRCDGCGAALRVRYDRDRLGVAPEAAAAPLSAFVSDEELRIGAPTPRVVAPQPQRSPAVNGEAQSASGDAASAEAMAFTPVELTLGQEIAAERRRNRWLIAIVGGLLMMDLVLAGFILFRRG